MNSLIGKGTLYVGGKAVGAVADMRAAARADIAWSMGVARDRLGQPGTLRDAPKQGAAPSPAPRKGMGMGPS